jgi:hypothetical protein
MKLLNLLILGSVFSLTACQDNEVVKKDNPPVESIGTGNSGSDTGGNSLRIYVLDVRYSRTTCSTGPGVCFKDGSGNIWSYDFIEVQGGGGEVGPLGVDVAGERLHLTFFRPLEEDAFIVEQDVALNDNVSAALGKSIVLKAGKYTVRHDAYKYGEAYVDLVSK